MSRSKLYNEQLSWMQMIKDATPGGCGNHNTVAQRLEVIKPQSATDKPIRNGIGECSACHKHKQLWTGVCGWCGADPEDFIEE